MSESFRSVNFEDARAMKTQSYRICLEIRINESCKVLAEQTLFGLEVKKVVAA